MDKKAVIGLIQLKQSKALPRDGGIAHGLTLTPDGKKLYVTSQVSDSVSVVDISTLEVEKEIPLGHNPNWIEFSKDGKMAYASNTDSDNISVIDIKQGNVIASIPVGSHPKRLAVGEVKIR